ncbi:MAG: DUF6515 family protein [Mucilaginibacter sp.]
MKSIHKILTTIAFSGILTVSLALSASAQHDHTVGSGGGSRPSSGGGGAVSQPSGGFSGGHTFTQPSRPSFSGHVNVQQPRVNQNNNNYIRQNNNYIRQNNNNYTRPTAVGRPNFGGARGGAAISTAPQYSGHVIGGGQHIGVTAQPYRTYQGSVYGHNHPGSPYEGHYHGYLPGNTYYHYNRGYYGTYYRPRLGFTVGVLPYGYYPFYWGDYEYFYSDGLFYQYDNDEYTVVEPPVGAEITTLPSDAKSIVINGQQYYEENGVYYKPITKDDGTLVYEVAGKDGELNTDDDNGDNGGYNMPPAPQIGDIVQQLPQGSRRFNINGQVMFMSPDGVYYQAFVDEDGNTDYKIVGLPDDQGDNGDQDN